MSAASFVGRVGALALALGIGVAVAGGVGVAHAEGPADDTAGGSATQSSPETSTGADTTDADTAEASDSGTTGVKTRPPGSSNVPKMQLGNGRGASTSDHHDTPEGRGSLPELISSIPQKLAEALVPRTPGGASGSSTTHTGAPATPRVRSRTSDTVSDVSTRAPSTSPPADAPAPRGDVEAVRLVPSQTITQKPVFTPSTTIAVPLSAVTSAASVQIAPTQARSAPANPIAMAVANVLSALGIAPSASSTGGSPVAPMPMPMVQAVLQLVHREIERFTFSLSHVWPTTSHISIPTNAVPAIAPGVPTPADEATTVYGDIGKWMLQSNGQISNYGGLPYGGRTVLEPVNVIIVDPTSKSAAESACKLNTAMFWSGFPAQPIHSTGFKGTIDDVTYGQQPTGLLLGFSDNFFLFPNNHGRIFGPDPVETSTGYVWSGAFSTEQFVIYDFLPRHAYVSSNMARNALAMRLIASGQATYGGMVPLDNSYNTATTTTGDHDGYAVVIILK